MLGTGSKNPLLKLKDLALRGFFHQISRAAGALSLHPKIFEILKAKRLPMCAGPSRRCGFVSCARERNLRFLSLKPFLPCPLPPVALISTGRLADDLVAEAKTTGDDRWKPSRSCWAAC